MPLLSTAADSSEDAPQWLLARLVVAAGAASGARFRTCSRGHRQRLDAGGGALWREALVCYFPDTLLPEGLVPPEVASAGPEWLAALGAEVSFHSKASLYTVLRRGGAAWLREAVQRSARIIARDGGNYEDSLKRKEQLARILMAMKRPLAGASRGSENPFFLLISDVTEAWPDEKASTLATPYEARKVYEVRTRCVGRDFSRGLQVASAGAYLFQPLLFERACGPGRSAARWQDVSLQDFEAGLGKPVDWLALAADLLWECSCADADTVAPTPGEWRSLLEGLPST